MRLFIASTFPEPATRPFNDRLSQVRSRLPSASWVRPESQHLTFAFLGEQPESLVEELARSVQEKLANVPKFEARLQGCGFFPNPRHARVGWIGVEPEAGFNAVARAVREAVQGCGVALDRDNFRSHLTVMRVRDRWPPTCVELFCRTIDEVRSEPFVVDAVTLYSSQLNPQGAIHTPLRTFALA